MSTELDKLIGTKLSFQMNHASICGTMNPTFVLDSKLVNAAFQSALSNEIVATTQSYGLGCDFVS